MLKARQQNGSIDFETTEDKFKNRGIDSSIIEDWDVLPNNQILLHSKENKSSSLFPTILGVYILAESRKIMN
jgi:hypothetical protein